MINTFSLVLIIITGISGIFWCINKFYVLICNCNWYKLTFFLGKSKDFFQKSNNKIFLLISCLKIFFSFISSLFPMLLLVLIIRSFIIEPFQIPSGSMMPTLLIGDFILVNKYVYGIKNPVDQKTLIDIGSPKRGDVIVFKYPKDSTLDYIKRVIGKPGDKIVYNIVSKQLMIYPQDTHYKQALPIIYSNIVPSNFMQEFFPAQDGLVNMTFVEMGQNYQYNKFSKGIRLIQTTESLDNVKHDILTMVPPGDKNFIKIYDQYTTHLISEEWVVPAGEYFVMGDNRDNSADSRYWGCVPERNIVGKAIVVWMSLQKQEGKWPVGIRLHRFGSSIR